MLSRILSTPAARVAGAMPDRTPGWMRQRIKAATDDQTVRFLITGCAAAALFYTLSVAFILCGAPPFGGTVAAYAIAFVASYTVQHRWTFGGQHRHRAALPRYMVSQACCAILSGLIAHTVAAMGQPAFVISLVSTVATSVTSYGLSRYWVFALRR